MASPPLLRLPFAWCIFFHLIFKPLVSLNLQCLSYRQHLFDLAFLACLTISVFWFGALSLPAFNVIIGVVRFTCAILLLLFNFRDSEWVGKRSRGREGERGRILSWFNVQHGARLGTQCHDPGIMTWAKIKSHSTDWATQEPPFCSFLYLLCPFSIYLCFYIENIYTFLYRKHLRLKNAYIVVIYIT